MGMEEAQALISSAGLKLVTTANAKNNASSAGNLPVVVIHQTPAPGERVIAGSSIHLQFGRP